MRSVRSSSSSNYNDVTIPLHIRCFSTSKEGEEKEKTEADILRHGEMDQLLDAKLAARRALKLGRSTALRHDKELYKQIRRTATMHKEKGRRNMIMNVNRALIGNLFICVAKFGAWISSGSSGMLAEFVHSMVDSGNQALLLVGLRDMRMGADGKHPYGYGKSVYFWALVSALGTFFLGAGITMTHSITHLMEPCLEVIPWQVYGVLGFGFVVDGYVLTKTVQETRLQMPSGVTFFEHLSNMRDPATLAIVLEDGGACLGVVIAFAGIAASHYTGNPMYDGMAGVGISCLLGTMGLTLVRVNHRFLLGQAVDKHITDGISEILLSRNTIEGVASVQSQWTGPETFSYKAEVRTHASDI
jgi:zinc transporter 9